MTRNIPTGNPGTGLPAPRLEDQLARVTELLEQMRWFCYCGTANGINLPACRVCGCKGMR